MTMHFLKVLQHGADDHTNARNRRPEQPVFYALVLLIVSLSAVLTGCTKDEPQVVVYISADEYLGRKIIERFEQETGIIVQFVGDTELNKTTGLVQRLRNEADNPQADVFWSSEVFQTIQLAGEGIFEPYESPVATDWPARFVDAEHRWYGFAARARVIVYSPQRVSEDAVPQTWMDLTDPRFRGRVVMADPRFGTTGGHLGAMQAYWDTNIAPQFYAAFLEGLAANACRLLSSGNGGVVEQVVAGEADVGLTDTDDVWVARQRGHDVAMVYPRHEVADDRGTGTLLIPNTVALVRGGPNPEHAKKLHDFLLSAEVERMIAESVSHNMPIRPGLAEEFPQYNIPNALRVRFDAAAAQRAEAVALAMHWLSEVQTTQPAVHAEPADNGVR